MAHTVLVTRLATAITRRGRIGLQTPDAKLLAIIEAHVLLESAIRHESLVRAIWTGRQRAKSSHTQNKRPSRAAGRPCEYATRMKHVSLETLPTDTQQTLQCKIEQQRVVATQYHQKLALIVIEQTFVT